MSSSAVAIVSVGMMTSVGLSAAETAASVRAGTMRFKQTEWLDKCLKPFTVAEVPEDALPDLNEAIARNIDLTCREARLLRLGGGALAQCLKPLPSVERLGLMLALPETETTRPLEPVRLLQHLSQQTGTAFDPVRSSSQWRGRAGGLAAIGHASALIREGRAKFMLAGGIDTYRDLFVLGALDSETRAKSDANLDGFIPGEGACFLLLASLQAALQASLAPLATVSQTVEGTEPGHLYSQQTYRGEGLAGTLQRLLEQTAPREPIHEVYSSMNGENHWSKEWGVAFLRNQAAFAPSHRTHHPADCFGETGAACGPLLTGLAALGLARGYLRSACLVYGSSDYGQRAALTVSASATN